MLELYRDNFCTIIISGEKGCYTNAVLDYIEFSPSVARYIATRYKNNVRLGCKLIDFVSKSK